MTSMALYTAPTVGGYGDVSGRFYVIEGLDGAGTTTQAALLADHLEATLTHEPTDRGIGRVIRRILQAEPGAPDKTTLPWLFAADRADHVASVITPALAAGQHVVSDRYYHSSLAYQSLDLPLDYVMRLNERFRAPDLTIYLHLPVEEACRRIASRAGVREIFEKEKTLRSIQEQYELVLSALAERGERVVRLDATQHIHAIRDQIQDLV